MTAQEKQRPSGKLPRDLEKEGNKQKRPRRKRGLFRPKEESGLEGDRKNQRFLSIAVLK